MANIMDYLDWRGDLSFEQSPFNEVDNLILCKLCNVDLTGIVPEAGSAVTASEAAERYFATHSENERLGVFIPTDVLPMFRRMTETVRFGGIHMSDYINRIDMAREEQFSALTIGLSDGTKFITFRGTDDTIVAWKENFNMSSFDAVPAQTDASAYLLSSSQRSDGPIRVGGHSKGGNLAVYAAMHNPSEVQDRIINVYNNDGPGFRESVLDTPEYRRIRMKVVTLVPQYSLVGMLLSHEEEYEIIKSDEAGIAAHNGFTWEVRGVRFVRSGDFALRSRLFDSAVHAWETGMDLKQRRQFVDTLFAILTSTGAKTLTDLNEHKLRQAIEIANGLYQDREQRELIVMTLELLIKEYMNSARAVLPIPKIPLKGVLGRKKKPEDGE
ncbi:MAG: Mbeg1-like protein [Oscillospiraceae bacterium]